MASPGARFRLALREERPLQIVGTIIANHALMAQQVGYKAIYLSGGGVAAGSLGMPDLGINTLDDVLVDTRRITDVCELPLLVDIDTGFGNAVNVAYVVPRYVEAGVAAVVMEDKTFPKDSSLRAGGRQELVPVGEFQGKIAAAKAAAGDVVVIARTEALIAGLGEKEALARGAAYAEAGADGVLIHSKQKTPDEILSFCRAWDGRVALVLVGDADLPDVTALADMMRPCRANHEAIADRAHVIGIDLLTDDPVLVGIDHQTGGGAAERFG